MRRRLSTSFSVDDSEPIVKDPIDESDDDLIVWSKSTKDTENEEQIDSVEFHPDVALTIEPTSVQSFVSKELFRKKSFWIIVTSSVVILIIFSLLIHKILTSIQDTEIGSKQNETKPHLSLTL
ncbi:Hypothetical predicted protein [Mytilus galloprovincialis]|uniref:Uncharacterized protein n=1 Tax=Mytilus galloprovincialis TaxID=29158 RepID=A0A8B6HKG7_MYTGA|nr:Hypothetical predicted protein [Mytilus galloprovincialis]